MFQSFLSSKYGISIKKIKDKLSKFILDDEKRLNDISLNDILKLFNSDTNNLVFECILHFDSTDGYSSHSQECSTYGLDIYKSNKNIIVYQYDTEVETESGDLYAFDINYNYENPLNFFNECFTIYPISGEDFKLMENTYIYDNYKLNNNYEIIALYFFNMYKTNAKQELSKYINHITANYFIELEKLEKKS